MAHTSCCTESLSVSLVLPKIQSFPWGLAESVVVEWVMCWSNWGLGKWRMVHLLGDGKTEGGRCVCMYVCAHYVCICVRERKRDPFKHNYAYSIEYQVES